MYRYYWKNSHIFGISEIWRAGFLLSVVQNITCPNNTVEWNVINSKVILGRGNTNDHIYVVQFSPFCSWRFIYWAAHSEVLLFEFVLSNNRAMQELLYKKDLRASLHVCRKLNMCFAAHPKRSFIGDKT